jgi:hypothetical protein
VECLLADLPESSSSHIGPAIGANPCGCACNIAGNITFIIKNSVTINCNLSFSGSSSLIISNGGSLTVTGNSTEGGKATFDIQSGGSMSVDGNFNLSGSSNVEVSGNLTVTGIIDISGGNFTCDSANNFVAGNVSGSTSCGSIVLPVLLKHHQISQFNNKVLIQWSTWSELNNSHFIISKSLNNNDFFPIGTVEEAGNSNSVNEYEFIDETVTKGNVFYKIEQIDFDGTRQVVFKGVTNVAETNDFKIFPNVAQINQPVYIQHNHNKNSISLVEVIHASDKTNLFVLSC